MLPGCTCDRFLHAHHVHLWAEGGATHLDNLILLCSRHHRLVHEGGFEVVLTGSGPLFSNPHGKQVVAALPPAAHADPLPDWRTQHSWINAMTTMPDWDGENPDYEEMLKPMFQRWSVRETPS